MMPISILHMLNVLTHFRIMQEIVIALRQIPYVVLFIINVRRLCTFQQNNILRKDIKY